MEKPSELAGELTVGLITWFLTPVPCFRMPYVIGCPAQSWDPSPCPAERGNTWRGSLCAEGGEVATARPASLLLVPGNTGVCGVWTLLSQPPPPFSF